MRKISSLVVALLLGVQAFAAAPDTARPDKRANTDAELVAPPNYQEHFVAVVADSGDVTAPADAEGLVSVYAVEASAPGAPWIRLRFDKVTLAGIIGTPDAAMLRITSLEDGAVQYLDAVSVKQWGLRTAYFNGDTVLVELLAAPGAGPSRVSIAGVIAGEPVQGAPRSLCGTVDDRVLSSDPRVGRLMPIGCTAWLFNNRPHCLITAGHCGPDPASVMQFNVPLSNAAGNPVAPPPQDQYPVDPASIQSTGPLGVGNDWSTFGVFDNSNTGLSPLEAQGDSFTLADEAPPVAGQTIRVTGFGTTASPVPATWNQAQKTDAGPYTENLGPIIRYAMDTTGGNSGSPIIDESTGLAIGIHTHAGCNDVGGNQGSNINLPDLQYALAHPLGVCIPPGLNFSYPLGLPASIDPDGMTTLRVAISPDDGVTLDTGAVMLHTVAPNLAETLVPMGEVSPGVFEGAFPTAACASTVRFYVSANDTAADVHTDPRDAPEFLYTTYAADSLIVTADFNFETAPGWTVVNDPSLTAGAWQIGIPLNNGRGDPPADFDGSGRCYLTSNAFGDSDVDGGPTRLISPPFDLSGATDPVLSFAAWFSNSANDADRLEIELSPDGGAWTSVESIANQGDLWFERSYRIADYIALSAGVRVRFSVADVPNNSVLEAALDAFKIFEALCLEGCSPADLDKPFGSLDFSDVVVFLTAFSEGAPEADLAPPLGVFDFSDVLAYLALFGGGCP
ncbi:MAG: GC-type dockerin domain-anchored protein [Phycisphaerales bacterium]